MGKRYCAASLREALLRVGGVCSGPGIVGGSVCVSFGARDREWGASLPLATYVVWEDGDVLCIASCETGDRPSTAAVFMHPARNPRHVSRAMDALLARPGDATAWERLFLSYDGGWYVASDILAQLEGSLLCGGETSTGSISAVMLQAARWLVRGLPLAGPDDGERMRPTGATVREWAALLREALAPLLQDVAYDGVFDYIEELTEDLEIWVPSLGAVFSCWESRGVSLDTYLFGSLYEQLKGRRERKDRGAYYTPRPLAEDTSRRCVEGHVVARANARTGRPYASIDAAVAFEDESWLAAARSSVASLSILDPSCGTGHFLEACLDALDVISTASGGGVCKGGYRTQVMGVDIDKGAVWVARMRLAIRALRRGDDVNGDGGIRVCWGDALLGKDSDAGSAAPPIDWPQLLKSCGVGAVSLIIGNPPYGKVKNLPIPPAEKAVIASRYARAFPSYRGNVDLYKLFLMRALSLADDDTSISFVIPVTFWGDKESQHLRRELLSRGCRYLAFLGLADSELFFGAGTHYELSVFCSGTPAPDGRIAYIAPDGNAALHIAKGDESFRLRHETVVAWSSLWRVPRFVNLAVELEILERAARFEPLESFLSSRVGVIDESLGRAHLTSRETEMLAFSSTHIKDWYVDLSPTPSPKRWVAGWHKLSSRMVRGPEGNPMTLDDFLKSDDAVVGRQMAHRGEVKKLHFALHPGRVVPTNGVRIVYPLKGMRSRLLCALLNSSTYNWYFSLFSHTYNVKPYELGELPAIPFSSEATRVVETLVDYAHILCAAAAAGLRGGTGTSIHVATLLDALVFEALCQERELAGMLSPYLLPLDCRSWLRAFWSEGGCLGTRVTGPFDALCAVLARIGSDVTIIRRLGELRAHPWAQVCLRVPSLEE